MSVRTMRKRACSGPSPITTPPLTFGSESSKQTSNLNTSSRLRLGELERQMADLRAKVISIEGRLPG